MADVAQWLERWIVAPEAVGSSPIIRPINILIRFKKDGFENNKKNIRIF